MKILCINHDRPLLLFCSVLWSPLCELPSVSIDIIHGNLSVEKVCTLHIFITCCIQTDKREKQYIILVYSIFYLKLYSLLIQKHRDFVFKRTRKHGILGGIIVYLVLLRTKQIRLVNAIIVNRVNL